MLYVVAKGISKKENVEETKKEMLSLIPLTLKEKGCVKYDLHQELENPEIFYFYEIWESKEDLDNHLNNDHLVAWSAKQKELLAAPMEVSLLKIVK